jgi:DNA-binding response OmpR family regulator
MDHHIPVFFAGFGSKSDDPWCTIRFVTAYPERGDRMMKADPEKTEIISKPFRREQLVAALRKYCQ